MNILAIDSVTEMCSVAVAVGDEIFQQQALQPQGHSNLLLPMVDAVLEQANISLARLDFLVVDTGPGAFTGVRIGLGVAQGLAYAAGLPVMGLTSLEILAAAIAVAATASPQLVLPAIDARMQQIYYGLYQVSAQQPPTALTVPAVTEPHRISDCPPQPVVGVGNGWEPYGDCLRAALSTTTVTVATAARYPCAQHAVQVAQWLAPAGQQPTLARPPQELQATYVREDVV